MPPTTPNASTGTLRSPPPRCEATALLTGRSSPGSIPAPGLFGSHGQHRLHKNHTEHPEPPPHRFRFPPGISAEIPLHQLKYHHRSLPLLLFFFSIFFLFLPFFFLNFFFFKREAGEGWWFYHQHKKPPSPWPGSTGTGRLPPNQLKLQQENSHFLPDFSLGGTRKKIAAV